MMKFFNETTFTNKNETFDPVLHIHTLNYAIFQNNKAYWHHSQPLHSARHFDLSIYLEIIRAWPEGAKRPRLTRKSVSAGPCPTIGNTGVQKRERKSTCSHYLCNFRPVYRKLKVSQDMVASVSFAIFR